MRQPTLALSRSKRPARRLSLLKSENATEGYLFLVEKDAEYRVDSSFGL
jgi:hypothetical protein